MHHNDDTSFYRRTLSDAFRLSWQHKHLWILGFFATFLGFGGVYDVMVNLYEKSAEALPSAAMLRSPLLLLPGYATLRTLIDFSPYPALSLLLFFILGSLTFALFAWFTVASLGGLIGSVRKIQQGGDPHFADGIKIGANKFWPLLAINLAAKLVSVCAFFFTGVNLYVVMTNRTPITAAFYVGSFIVFTAVAIAAALTAIYASIYAVIKNMPAGEAMKRGWSLFCTHWLVSLEMTLLLFVANLGVGLLAILAFLVLAVPIFFLFLVATLLQMSGLVTALFLLTAVAAIVVAVMFASFYTTVQISAWTLLWSELNDKKPVSKLFRLLQHLRSKRSS